MSGDTAAALQTQRRAAAFATATELDTNLAAFQQRIEQYEALLGVSDAEAAPGDDPETPAPAAAGGG